MLSPNLAEARPSHEDTRHIELSQPTEPNATSQALPTTALTTRHVTFQLDLGISTSSAESTQHHTPLPPERSQSPPESLATPPGPSDSGTDSESQSGVESVEMDDPNLTSSGTDSGSARPARHKHKHARAAPSPRACRNIKNIRRVGPAGNKRRGRALDVWSFFVCEDEENVCVFCKYVVSSSRYMVYEIGAVF